MMTCEWQVTRIEKVSTVGSDVEIGANGKMRCRANSRSVSTVT